MEISGKQSTKSYGTHRQVMNKVIWLRSGKPSTKSYGTCLASMTLLLLTPRPTSRRPPKRPTAAPVLLPAAGVVRRVTFVLLHAPRPCTLLASAPQLTRSMPLQEHSLRVQGPSIGQQRQQDILPRMRSVSYTHLTLPTTPYV